MNQRFQDAMALARHYQGFDLFITFTCNPFWPEITNELLHSQSTSDRPDLSVRVFNMYKNSLIHDLTVQWILSNTQAYVYTIEFQKQGLPHMHLLLSLSPAFRPTNADQVDTLISATWPDPEKQPLLFNIIKRCMVHGPFSSANPHAPSMNQAKSINDFPKPFQNQTVMNSNGYPTYACPDNGCMYEVHNFIANN